MNRKKLTPKRLQKFIDLVCEDANVTKAAQALNVSRQQLYEHRRHDEAFAARWDEAVEMGINKLEEEAYRRAYEGTYEPVFHLGAVCGYVRKYSDTLLMFMLNGAKPEKYRRNVSAEITGKNGAPIVPPTLGLKISFEDGGPGEQ